MSEDRHIIWSNYDLDYEDWRDDLEGEYPAAYLLHSLSQCGNEPQSVTVHYHIKIYV